MQNEETINTEGILKHGEKEALGHTCGESALNNTRRNQRTLKENAARLVFFLCACVSILSVIVIAFYIFYKGMPIFFKVGFWDIVAGSEWQPLAGIFGILPMITASLFATLGAVLIGGIIGILMAVFLAEIAPERFAKAVRPVVELLAGIPSIVYGFFGLIVFVPLIDKAYGGGGNSLLAGIILLAVMILPTVISVSETALRGVPKEYKEGSLALGATHIQTIFKVMIPSARSGILASIVLGMGRAVGETMAVILVIGNTPQIPHSALERVRTLTANIAIEMSYASGLHQEALFATGVVLFVFIMLLNIVLNLFIHRAGEEA